MPAAAEAWASAAVGAVAPVSSLCLPHLPPEGASRAKGIQLPVSASPGSCWLPEAASCRQSPRSCFLFLENSLDRPSLLQNSVWGYPGGASSRIPCSLPCHGSAFCFTLAFRFLQPDLQGHKHPKLPCFSAITSKSPAQSPVLAPPITSRMCSIKCFSNISCCAQLIHLGLQPAPQDSLYDM